MNLASLILGEIAFVELLIIIFLFILLNKKSKRLRKDKDVPVKKEPATDLKTTQTKATSLKKRKEIRNLGKIIAILVPVLIIGYVIYSNFISNNDFNYIYDIGSEEDNSLTPQNRISDKIIEEKVNYRNLTGQLVYFDVPIPRGSDSVDVEIRFHNNFPENGKIAVGAKDQQEWHYLYNWVFNETSADFQNKNEWIVKSASFNIKEDNLYIKNGKLNMLLNIHHLNQNQNETNKMYVPVDWIKITIHKNGIFDKIRN